MKLFTKYALLSLMAAGASQAATLTFTNSGAGAYATGFGDSSGNVGFGLIWGVVVDTTGNGFATGLWDSGFSYTGGNTTGITLQSTAGGATDDVLFLNATVTSNLSTAVDGAAIGAGRVNSITSVTYGGAVAGLQPYAIIWFNRGIALGSASQDGQMFGLATGGTNASPLFRLPAANGDTIDYSPAFLGADPVKTANISLGGAVIPEPSAALLGAIGALGLLRRRRN